MVELRSLSIEDLPFLLEVRNESSTRENLENNQVFSLEQCQEWFAELKSPWFIILNELGERVGYLRTSCSKEVGCDIHPNYRRKGYARQAYTYFLQNKEEAFLWVFEDNFATELYSSLGFFPTGEAKEVRGRKYIQMKLLNCL